MLRFCMAARGIHAAQRYGAQSVLTDDPESSGSHTQLRAVA
jgi:hypothetical protein